MRSHGTTSLLALLLLLGCGPAEPEPADAGPTDAAPSTDGGGGGSDSARPPPGDGNDSFADADPVTVGGAPVRARIGNPGDRDYYRFEGSAGDWIVLMTRTEDPGDGSPFADCVLQLFDASMTKIAENDDAIPRGVIGTPTDSEIIIRLPETGTYYVMVQEWSQWSETTPFEGDASYVYELIVEPLDPTAEQINIETEMGDTPIPAGHVRGTAADFGLIAGTFEAGGDLDVYTFSIAHRRNASFEVMPTLATGHGSTDLPARMWVTRGDGSEIIARIDDVSALSSIDPPLPDLGDYRFYIEGPSTSGSNPFYVVKGFRVARDNPPEREEATNGDPATPEVLTQEASATVMGRRDAFIRPDLPEGDTDWYQFDLMAGENINVFCGSRTAGSGIQDLRARVYDATGTTELATATETATEPIAIRDLEASPGTYLLRLDRGAQIADVTGTWVRCGVIVAPPTPAM